MGLFCDSVVRAEKENGGEDRTSEVLKRTKISCWSEGVDEDKKRERIGGSATHSKEDSPMCRAMTMAMNSINGTRQYGWLLSSNLLGSVETE